MLNEKNTPLIAVNELKQAPDFYIVRPKAQLTWSFLPLMVRLLMAHAASF